MTSSGTDIADFKYSKLLVASGDKGLPGSTNTNFRINLGFDVQKIKRISMISITFPNNAYNVNATGAGQNNDFGYVEGGVAHEFKLEGGFYTTATLMAAISAAINASFTNGESFTLTQDPISQIVSATYNQGASGNPFIYLVDTSQDTNQSSAWDLLGFGLNTVFSSGIPVTSDVKLNNGVATPATNLPNLGGLKEVYLQSNLLAPGNAYDSNIQRNILQCILIKAPFGVANIWECRVDKLCELSYKGPRTLSIVDFMLTDRFGNIVDLHGGNLTINLKVWFDRF